MAKKTKRAAAPAVHFSKKFESLYDLSEWVKATPADWKQNASVSGSEAFTGSASYDDAENMMLNGWDYGKNEITKIMMDRAASVDTVKRLALSYVGAVPCVPAYLAGSPKNMLAIRRRSVSRPVVSIAYNNAVGAEVEASDIMTAAAKLFNVVRGLELGGVSVELWVVNPVITYLAEDTFCTAVKIKSASQPLNVLNMCYPCVHPSFLRRQIFAVFERSGLPEKNWLLYGNCATGEKAKVLISNLGLSSDNVFSYYSLAGKTEKEIANMIH